MKRKKAQQSLVEEDCEEDILTENIQNLSSIEADSFGKNRAKLEASFSCHDLDHDAGSAKSQEIDDGEPPLVLPGGSFDLILVIDQREALSHKDQSAILTSQLLARKIPFTFRTLPIGDFVWICKGRTNNTEVTLDYVVERKREDDFISSILDGRYEEQKFRLKRSKMRHITYLIEKLPTLPFRPTYRPGNHPNGSVGSHQSCVMRFGRGKFLAALLSTQLQQFHLQFTESFQETLDYLVRMTTHLTAKYKNRDLKIFNQSQMDNVFTFGLSSQSLDSNAFESGQLGNPSTPTQRITHDTTVTLVSPLYRPLFQDFSRLHTKTLFLTQRDLYIKQLTCILHVTTEKALAISQLYPTLRQLLEAYERLDDLDRPYMLKDVKVMVGEDKGIGDKLSRKIYENFYGN